MTDEEIKQLINNNKNKIKYSKIFVNIIVFMLNILACIIVIVNNFKPEVFEKVIGALIGLNISYVSVIGAGKAVKKYVETKNDKKTKPTTGK